MLRKLRLDLAARMITAIAVIGLTLALLSPSRGSQASCIMPTSGTVSGLTLVNDINGCNNSLISVWSGASAPSGPQAGQFWYNTNTNYIQEYDGASWLNLWYVDATNHLITPQIGGGITSAVINSASTTDIGSVPQPYVTINPVTGPITSFGTSATVGTTHIITWTGTGNAVTYNATSMILPGAHDISTNAGAVMFALYLGSGNWKVTAYSPGTITVKGSPTTSDYILIEDVAASNRQSKSLISSLLALVGVTGIDSKTGAFTTGNGLDSTGGNVVEMTAARRTLPTIQVFTSSGSGTYTTPTNVLWIEVELLGGGSGGGGGTQSTLSTAGGASTFGGVLTANGGAGSNAPNPGAGGTASGGNLANIPGSVGANQGTAVAGAANSIGGGGGPSGCYNGSPAGGNGAVAGTAAVAGTGAGGGGGGLTNASINIAGAGGSGGGCVKHIINSPSATYSYTIGAGGAGAAAGSGAAGAGGAGGTGALRVIEHYGS